MAVPARSGGVGIVGRGIGAATAAHCLLGGGIPVVPMVPPGFSRGRAPLVMLGDQAQALLRDVFVGHAPLIAGLDGAHRITRRIVRWGGEDLHAVPHTGLVIAADRLGDALPWPDAAEACPRFSLSTEAPCGSALLRFGRREAAATPVVLRPEADRHAALVEAIEAGWLFCIPTGDDTGWLLTVGAEPDQALRESRLVAPALAATGAVSNRFETAPRMLDDPTAPGCLTLGSGAVAFDPICGDGVATAVRGGILAAAVAAGMVDGKNRELDHGALIGHYRAMLIAAMRRHLAVSWPFYARGGTGPWWQEQAEALAEGHAWCTRQLAAAGEARFVLAGNRLVPRDCAA
ncbi:hypothetical protein [Novosphingobium sp. Fuku2-ISO-50]|uniref:hypothetical protein n=1 Tax=Novosphingobium sp. Fuku2-ISO-50 TaxID=1739114 RepID=UPI000A6D8044|nr:hypothetical protein [Novosphingobium sp. Fuku2-ISO-50]